jgi:hypothetical protein
MNCSARPIFLAMRLNFIVLPKPWAGRWGCRPEAVLDTASLLTLAGFYTAVNPIDSDIFLRGYFLCDAQLQESQQCHSFLV